MKIKEPHQNGAQGFLFCFSGSWYAEDMQTTSNVLNMASV